MPIESAGEVVFQGGPAGTDGQSTYQAWLALGNVGAPADFMAAQRGATGPQGPQGIPGPQGPQGIPGSPSAGALLYNADQSLSRADMYRARKNASAGPIMGQNAFTGNTTFTVNDANKVHALNGSGFQHTVPEPSAMQEGDGYEFNNYGDGTQFVKTPSGAGVFWYSANYGAPSVAVEPGSCVKLICLGSSLYIVVRLAAPDRVLNANAAQNFSDVQKAQLLANAGLLIPHCQCRLVYVSPSQIKLIPWNGNQIWINGAYRTIPFAGILATNAGLGANALFAPVAYWTGSAIAIAFSTSSPVQDPTYGLRTMPGFPQQTYLGAVLTDASGNFRDDDSFRGIASAYNQARRSLSGIIASNGSTASTQGVTLGTALQFVLADPVACDFSTAGYTNNGTAGQFCRTDITLDQVAAGYPCLGTSSTANADVPISAHYTGTIPAGAHAINLFGTVSGGTGYWNTALFGALG